MNGLSSELTRPIDFLYSLWSKTMKIIRKIIVIISVLLISLSINGQIYDCSEVDKVRDFPFEFPELNVDSLFQTHFLSLDTHIKGEELQLIPIEDIKFIIMVSFLSNINIPIHSYSGHPFLNLKYLIQVKNWYCRNKNKLESDLIQKSLYILDNPFEIDRIEEFEKLIKLYQLEECSRE